ncbi:hypothetical protein A2U01_0008792, partial [Trifolium medium]|nr:hypothetical protein [Trifolium medium]
MCISGNVDLLLELPTIGSEEADKVTLPDQPDVMFIQYVGYIITKGLVENPFGWNR